MRDKYLDLIQKIVINEINPENGARIHYLVSLIENHHDISRDELIANLVVLHRDNEFYNNALKNIYLPRNWWIKTLGFPFSMIGEKRIKNVRYAAETVIKDKIPGALMETGVWRGGACIMMKAVLNAYNDGRQIYVCDSFDGLPTMTAGPDSQLNLDQNPVLTAPLDDVKSHFERLDLLDDNVHFVKGWFNETMPQLNESVETDGISVLRLDGDYYSSTMDVLVNMYEKVSRGGFVIVDDYHSYDQCKSAVSDFLEANNIAPELIDIDGAGVYWRK